MTGAERGWRCRLEETLRDFELAVELTVGGGERLALVGPSGAGKSTRAAGGRRAAPPATAGASTLDGELWLDTEAGVDLPPERRRCGFLFQGYALFDHLSAGATSPTGCAAPAGRRAPRAGAGAAAALRGRAPRRGAPPASSPAASASASPSRGRSRPSRARCCSTSRCRRSTRPPGRVGDPRAGAMLAEVGVPTVVVTHDFSEAALLRRGSRSSTAAGSSRPAPPARSRPGRARPSSPASPAPRSSPATARAGDPRPHRRRARRRRRPCAASTPARVAVAVSVFPWEIALEPPPAPRRLRPQPPRGRGHLGDRGRQPRSRRPADAPAAGGRDHRPLRPRPRPAARLAGDAAWKATATRLVDV